MNYCNIFLKGLHIVLNSSAYLTRVWYGDTSQAPRMARCLHIIGAPQFWHHGKITRQKSRGRRTIEAPHYSQE